MQLKTLEWARGLCASLKLEIDSLISSPVSDAQTLERVVAFRQQLKQAEALVAALEAQFPDAVEIKDVEDCGE